MKVSEGLDCRDSSCRFAFSRGGMRTNGGCRCLKELDHDPPRRMATTMAIQEMRDELLALRKIADAAAAWDDTTTLPAGKAAWDALREALRKAGR